MNTPPEHPPARILVIDDEPDLRTLYELCLLRDGHDIQTAENMAQARFALQSGLFDVVIADIRLPDGSGMDLLSEAQGSQRPERWIMATAYGSAENAVQALKSGAFDYLTKPIEPKQLRQLVHSAISAARQNQAKQLADTPRASSADESAAARPKANIEISAVGQKALQRIAGQSDAMQAVRKRIIKVARSMAPILIGGESGTGKELVAQAIHACSHRHAGPFVPVNCGAIPENLLEAEFFGAKKGAYTGAAQDRIGFFQAARGGTLFLDEIGDLPLAMQAKLLRAIQERRVRPLGSTQEEEVDVRLLSATHKNLAQEVENQSFRQDLYYRINVIDINLPALSQRREDIPDICQALLARMPHENGARPQITDEQLAIIQNAPLSGNVRELENLLYRALTLGSDARLLADEQLAATTPQRLGAPVAPETASAATSSPHAGTNRQPASTAWAAASSSRSGPDLASWLNAQERLALQQALQLCDFDLACAAAHLRMSTRQLHYRMLRLGMANRG